VDGAGTLFPQKDTEISGLHVVSKKEAFSRLDKWKKSHPERRQLVSGAALMQNALREKDWPRFQNALDLVQQWVPHFAGDAEIRHIRGSNSWKKAVWAYSGLMSNLLQTARFIIWYSPKDNRLRPGLFCPDWEVAVYAVVGMDYIRICKKPGCGEPFIPVPNQECCTQAHANALRVAVWKIAHPERAKEQARRKSRNAK
jgi:hypothetical protein